MTFTPMDPSELEGKSRAELLDLCRPAGFKATGWKRDRMFAALTGAEAQPEPKRAVIADQLDRREPAGDLAAKALANREKRTGRCLSTVCAARCEAYEPGGKDAFHWQMCACGHTQWAHKVGEPG